MIVAAEPKDRRRGSGLLLEHCARIGSLEDERPPAKSRLETLLGEQHARLLVFALTGSQGLRPRARPGRRGSSSP